MASLSLHGSVVALCGAIGLSAVPVSPLLAADTDTIESDDKLIEEIIVTGSRIPRTEFTSPVPVQVIDMEAAALAGQHDLQNILQESTLAVSAPQINNSVGYHWRFSGERHAHYGGDGVSTVDLRGLGAGRTLVLLNGRRLNPAGTKGTVSAVDLNTIPASMIERIEILKDGASSIYGSDAVSGVINIITKKELDGIHGNLWVNVPSEGDGEVASGSISFGAERGEASFLFGIDYFEQFSLKLGDRDWTQCARDFARNPETGEELNTIDPATGMPKCYDAPPNDYIINFSEFPVTGRESRSIWDPNIDAWRVADRSEFPFDDPSADYKNIVNPVKRISVHSFGNWPMRALGGGAQGYYEFLYNNRRSDQDWGPKGLLIDLVESPWSPFYNDQGWAVDTSTLIPYMDSSWQEVDWVRGVLGAIGEFSNGWSWEFSVGYGYSDGDYGSTEHRHDLIANMEDVVEIAPGVYDCVVNQLPGSDGHCVPINPYAIIRDGLNSPGEFPRDVLDYIRHDEESSTTYDQQFVMAYVSGEMFEMPGGTVKAVFGVEGRRESIEDIPDPWRQASPGTGSGPRGITEGSIKVGEAFAEIEMPLLRDVTAARDVTINAAGRYSDYDIAGSDATYRIGLNWQIVDQLRLRASYGTSFRAPALFENFLGSVAGPQHIWDTCRDYLENPFYSANVYENCSAEVGDAIVSRTTPTLVVTEGNEGRLDPETSTSLTAGLVVNFEAIDLAIALDYFEFEIEGEIGNFGPGELIYRCYDLPPDEFRQPGTICDYVSERRPGSNTIGLVDDSFFNINKKYNEGIDLTVRYAFDIGAVDIVADLRATKILELTREYFDGYSFDLNGSIGYADKNGQFDLRANFRDWTFFYGLDYIAGQSSYYLNDEDPADSMWNLATDDVFYHDFSVGYEWETWNVSVGVRNLEDKKPPEVSRFWASQAGNAALNSHYDYLGRRYFANLSASF